MLDGGTPDQGGSTRPPPRLHPSVTTTTPGHRRSLRRRQDRPRRGRRNPARSPGVIPGGRIVLGQSRVAPRGSLPHQATCWVQQKVNKSALEHARLFERPRLDKAVLASCPESTRGAGLHF